MKLRFRSNTLRLRVNRREVHALAAGASVREQIVFPDNARIIYVLEPKTDTAPAHVSFTQGVISVTAPIAEVQDWAESDSIGLYFDVPGESVSLGVAIEKDLECVDGPVEERDPEAFPRPSPLAC